MTDAVQWGLVRSPHERYVRRLDDLHDCLGGLRQRLLDCGNREDADLITRCRQEMEALECMVNIADQEIMFAARDGTDRDPYRYAMVNLYRSGDVDLEALQAWWRDLPPYAPTDSAVPERALGVNVEGQP